MDKETWLVLEDNVIDRILIAQAIGLCADKIQLVMAGTAREALELLKNNDFSACLLDFCLKGKKTSESLITEIRSTWPSIPIIVVSRLGGKSEKLNKAGADNVIPKQTDSVPFGTSIVSAVSLAKYIHQIHDHSSEFISVYIAKKAKTAFNLAAKRDSGNTIIFSPPGMGRSELARNLGEILRHIHKSSYSDEILHVSCKEFANTPDTIMNIIFDSAQNKNLHPTAGILNLARTAVLIIDDAHLLPKQVQEKIKLAFENGYFKLNTGEKVHTSHLRLILTVQVGEENLLIQGFLQCLLACRVEIPSFAGMLNEVSEIITFGFRQSIQNKQQNKMKMSPSFKRCLAKNIQQAPTRVTMRSVVKTIEAAIENTLENKRLRVTQTDLRDFEFLYENIQTRNVFSSDSQIFVFPEDDPIGIAAWKEIYIAINNARLADTLSLTRKAAVKSALVQTGGNRTKAAEKLGILRQSLYKEHLRVSPLRTGKNPK